MKRGGAVIRNLSPLVWIPSSDYEPTATPVKMAQINARSVSNTTFILNNVFITRELDFLMVTETWLHAGESVPLIQLCPDDCNFVSTPRLSGHGRDLAAVFKKQFYCCVLNTAHYSSCEVQLINVGLTNPILIALVYRPPRLQKDFIPQFADFVSTTMPNFDSPYSW